MYLENKTQYDSTAREWVKQYANIEALEASIIQKLTEMGFTDAQAREALVKVSWDEVAAINSLLGG